MREEGGEMRGEEGMNERLITNFSVPRTMLRYFILTLFFNTIIALLLSSGMILRFEESLIFSQCIGISICISVNIAIRLGAARKYLLTVITAAIVTGSVVGSISAAVILGNDVFFLRYDLLLSPIIFGCLFGIVITNFFVSQSRITESQAIVREKENKILSDKKRLLEIRLRLLQAQIEPHFLFNSLSSVLSLIHTDPDRAGSMLESLTDYLRASLTRTREESVTLGQELNTVRAYLNIFKVRLESRLDFVIQVHDELSNIPFPPMLLQPLIENAIVHGIEPAVEGGVIRISCSAENGCMRLVVEDTGMGFQDKTGRGGIGLTNIRERLEGLYGPQGRLILEENQPGGVRAVIEVPYDKKTNHKSQITNK